MRYLGGKERVAKQLCEYLESIREPGQMFTDLTVGGVSIISRMSSPKKGFDKHDALIYLYNALSADEMGLPSNVTRDEYKAAKSMPDNSPVKAFIGFGCSFSGKYFGGYATDSVGRNYAMNAKRSLEKKFKTLKGTKFKHGDLFDYEAYGELIYIDPPYASTTKYSVDFNYDKFWDKVRRLSVNNDVYVSEYTAPDDFIICLEIDKRLGLRKKEGGQVVTVERLFTMRRP